MVPFPSSKVIHPRFSEHHQPTAQGAMTATCRVERPGIGTSWDPDTESTIPNPPTVLIPSGTVCRVQAFMRAKAGQQAGQTVVERRYQVSIPVGDPDVFSDTFTDVFGVTTEGVDLNCRVIIEASRNDAAMVGAEFFIEDIQMGSERFQRDLICTYPEG